jgi:phospholipase/carboxylesterase
MIDTHPSTNRRTFCKIAGSTVVSLALSTACRRSWSNLPTDGKLKARPRSGAGVPPADHAQDARATPNAGNPSPGKPIALGLDGERDAFLYVPKSATKSPLPLLLFLHGATQSAEDMFGYLDSAPDETGVTILAPKSRDTTWDAITGSFGPDVDFLNRALERTFETVAIDPARMAIGGFSDGATYAVSLGLINGDFFKRVAAFSPGFVIDGTTQGKPEFFISHGTRDHILPIDRCGRRIAADLKTHGYEVTFREFDGDHEIPVDVMREGLRWVASA